MTESSSDLLVRFAIPALQAAALYFLALCIRRRRWAWALIPTAAVAILVVLPFGVIASLLIFEDVAIRNVKAAAAAMRNRPVVGWTTDDLVRAYGRPASVVPMGEHTRWYYHASPWYVIELNELYVDVKNGKVDFVGIDLF